MTADPAPSKRQSTLRSLRELYFELGRALAEQKRHPEAIAAFEQSKKERGATPADGEILVKLAEVHHLSHDDEAAFKTYLQAAAIDASYMGDALALADRLLTNDPKLARTVANWMDTVKGWLSKLLVGRRGETVRRDALFFLARAHLKAENFTRVAEVMAEVEPLIGASDTLRKEAAEMLYQAGQKLFQPDKLESAVDAFRRANALRPEHMPTYWHLVDALRAKSWITEPPNVREEDVREALAVWDKAIQRSLPDKRNSWAYRARANLNEQLARLPGMHRWTLGWEAVSYCERAFAIERQDSWNWAALARWYRFLGLDSSEDHATSMVLQANEEEVAAVEERIICLVNAGRFSEALPLIARWRKVKNETAWPDAVEAFILARSDNQEDLVKAKALIDSAITSGFDQIWCHEIRAQCCLRLAPPQMEEAAKDWQWVQERRRDDDIENQTSFGYAEYQLGLSAGEMKRAIEIYERFKPNALPTDANFFISLGNAYLANGDVENGRKFVEQTIRVTRNIRVLSDALELDWPNLERASSHWDYGTAVRGALAPLRLQAESRIDEIRTTPLSAEDELKFWRDERSNDDAGGWLWIGAQAGLARLKSEESVSEKTALYVELWRKAGDRFPEARDWLLRYAEDLEDSLLDGQQREAGFEFLMDLYRTLDAPREQFRLNSRMGERLLSGGQHEEAIQLFDAAKTLAEETRDGRDQAESLARLAYARFRAQDDVTAQANLIEAVHLFAESAGESPSVSLARVIKPLLGSPQDMWDVVDALEQVAGDSEDADLRAQLADASRSLLTFLDRYWKLNVRYSSKLEPSTLPIVLDIGRGLIPEDTSKSWPLIKTHIPEMRDRIVKQFGVTLPGVRIRANEDLRKNQYAIGLDEDLLAHEAGDVQLGMRYCPEPSAHLLELGVPSADLIEQSNPLDGTPGCWLSPEHWQLASDRGLELWPELSEPPEPLAFAVRHLERVVIDHLGEFLGIQETEALLDRWSQANAELAEPSSRETSDADQRPSSPSSPPSFWTSDVVKRFHFARLLRALAYQRVPLRDGDRILKAASGLSLSADTVSADVRALRTQLRDVLPGNQAGARRIWLPEEMESSVAAELADRDGHDQFDLPREAADDFIAQLRDFDDGAVSESDGVDATLIVRRAELAPFIRGLVRYELPRLTVLSEEELLATNANQTQTVDTTQ